MIRRRHKRNAGWWAGAGAGLVLSLAGIWYARHVSEMGSNPMAMENAKRGAEAQRGQGLPDRFEEGELDASYRDLMKLGGE